MPTPVHATIDDLTEGGWMQTDDIGPETTANLRRASRLVDRATRTALYDVDETDAPTSETVAELLRDATCAQVAYWAETGDASGAGAVWADISIGGVSLRRAEQDGGTAQGRYAPELADILAPLRRRVQVP